MLIKSQLHTSITIKTSQTKWLQEPKKTFNETTGRIRPEWVNKWSISLTYMTRPQCTLLNTEHMKYFKWKFYTLMSPVFYVM